MLLSKGVKTGCITLSSNGSGPNWARASLASTSQSNNNNNNNGSIHADEVENFWEDWKQTARDRLDGCTIRGHKVSLSPSPSENLLCVARLPRDLDEEEFRDLVASYGDVRRSFLLYSDKTGESTTRPGITKKKKTCFVRPFFTFVMFVIVCVQVRAKVTASWNTAAGRSGNEPKPDWMVVATKDNCSPATGSTRPPSPWPASIRSSSTSTACRTASGTWANSGSSFPKWPIHPIVR